MDEFIRCVGERNTVTSRQANCLTIILPSGKHNYLSTHITSSQSQSQTQYQEYLYDNNISNKWDSNERNSLRSAGSTPKNMIRKPSGKQNDNTPRQSGRRSEISKPRTVACNLGKVKRVFSTVEYLIT